MNWRHAIEIHGVADRRDQCESRLPGSVARSSANVRATANGGRQMADSLALAMDGDGQTNAVSACKSADAIAGP